VTSVYETVVIKMLILLFQETVWVVITDTSFPRKTATTTLTVGAVPIYILVDGGTGPAIIAI
jgi:hypothetical protein